MANFDSDLLTGQVSVNVRNRPLGTRVSSQAWIAEPIYTTTATEVTTDIIRWLWLPSGSKLLTERCWFWSEGVGGTAVILTSFGDEADNARYATADIAVTAASTATIAVTPLAAVMLPRYTIVEASKTLVTVVTGTLPVTVNKRIVGHFEYLMP